MSETGKDNLLERLNIASDYLLKKEIVASDAITLYQEAADEISRLRALVEQQKRALEASIRCAKLALFVIRKQGVMPNSSWEAGFNSDLKIAEDARTAYEAARAGGDSQ